MKKVLLMKRFKQKPTKAVKILNLQEELEFCDQLITITDSYDNNPMNDVDVKRIITKCERTLYSDKNGNLYSKEFIDLYYDEVK